MCKEAHEFRGEFIDLCARVENWLSAALAQDDAKSPRSRKAYLFGQKIKAVTDLVVAQPEIFSNPARVGQLLLQFQPFAELRAELAHAVVTVTKDKQPAFLFTGVGSQPLNKTWRFWITPTEAKTITADLKNLAKQFCDQKLKV